MDTLDAVRQRTVNAYTTYQDNLRCIVNFHFKIMSELEFSFLLLFDKSIMFGPELKFDFTDFALNLHEDKFGLINPLTPTSNFFGPGTTRSEMAIKTKNQ